MSGSLKDAMIKSGLISKEYATSKEKQEIAEKKAREKARTEIRENIRKSLEFPKLPIPEPKKLEDFALLGSIFDELVKNVEGEYKVHSCMICGEPGSGRIDIAKAHKEIIDELGFKFLIDGEERRRFFEALRDKVGIMLDDLVVGDGRKFWICNPCRRKAQEGDKNPEFFKFCEALGIEYPK